MSERRQDRSLHEEISWSRPRRRKEDWAGVTMASFRSSDYFDRLLAQRHFYRAVRSAQGAAASAAGESPSSAPKVRPQLTPFWTSCPGALSWRASIGWTSTLEFKARAGTRTLIWLMRDYLTDPNKHHEAAVAPQILKQVAVMTAEVIQNRMLLSSLRRVVGLGSVEHYRIFQASQAGRFPSLLDILYAAIVFGDLIDLDERVLHPLTFALLDRVIAASASYLDAMETQPEHRWPEIGAAWTRDIVTTLIPFQPPPKEAAGPDGAEASPAVQCLAKLAGPPRFRNPAGADDGQSKPSDRLAPLGSPPPPSLFPEAGPQPGARALVAELVRDSIENPDADTEQARELIGLAAALPVFLDAITKASGQAPDSWEDPRSDLLEAEVASKPFEPGQLSGTVEEGHEVEARLAGGERVAGQLFDRPLELSDDDRARDKLVAESRPIAEELRRLLYPNIENLTEAVRYKTAGNLDARRLVLFPFSQTIFKRTAIRTRGDKRGRPVLLVACDASGSLSGPQVRMLKCLCAAWLSAVARLEVVLLAAVYHSGSVHGGMQAPLVQWLAHPRKVPARRLDGVRALVSLPDDSGTGAQSDALSLSYLLEEAKKLAQGRRVFLTLMTDCAWNKSFPASPKTPAQEVRALIESAYEEMKERLHVTLVALGVSGKTGLEDVIDKVLPVAPTDLADHAAVARKIATFVAGTLQERGRSSQ